MNKFNKKLYSGFLLFITASILTGGCGKFPAREFEVDKPQSLVDQEELNSYNALKTYVDYSSQPNFKLGVELGFNDVVNNSILYKLVPKHFDQISFTSLNHVDYVQADGKVSVESFNKALNANEPYSMPVYAGQLVWHSQQRAAYLNSLIANVVLPGVSGSDVLVNFENNSIGDTYPATSSAASATIVADPDGKSGKAIRILKVTGTAYPQFNITLPGGRKLGYYKNIMVDFKGGTCCGYYGAGMQAAISTTLGPVTLKGYGGPSSFGIAADQWGRGMIKLPVATLNLTDEQKELTSFVLTIGSNTGSPDYLLDNITMDWEIPGQTIIKTPEEKAVIIRGELEKWIKAVAEAGKGRVKSWSVIYQPIDETNPSTLRSGTGIGTLPDNTFYWQDYLGKDYAAISIAMVKQYSSADDKIFFTETNLVDNPAKIHGLTALIEYTEAKGVKVDGIATELALNIASDRQKIETMLSVLAATGKLIKIASLDIGINASKSQATDGLYKQQADMYKWFVEAYLRLIPANKRAGITFRSPVDQSASSAWRANEPVGLWTDQFLRKKAYAAVADAFYGLHK